MKNGMVWLLHKLDIWDRLVTRNTLPNNNTDVYGAVSKNIPKNQSDYSGLQLEA